MADGFDTKLEYNYRLRQMGFTKVDSLKMGTRSVTGGLCASRAKPKAFVISHRYSGDESLLAPVVS